MAQIAQNGPFWSENGLKWSKTTVFPHFLVEKTDFGDIIKLIFWAKVRFLEIIYAKLCEKWPKMVIFGPKMGIFGPNMALNGRKPLYFHIFWV